MLHTRHKASYCYVPAARLAFSARADVFVGATGEEVNPLVISLPRLAGAKRVTCASVSLRGRVTCVSLAPRLSGGGRDRSLQP